VRRFVRLVSSLFLLAVVAFLVVGYFMPFEDREGRCTICGMQVYEKSSLWLKQPITITRDTPLSRYYEQAGLPEHEHRWEFMGGVTYTNLFSIPGRYEFERSDPLLLVPDDFMIEVLRRLSVPEAQVELLRGLNCDDEDVREEVREHLYISYPGAIGSFLAWWEEYISGRGGVVPCAALPGPPWEKRAEEGEEFPTSGAITDEAGVE
jgi:hypothetical protein